MEGIQKGYLFGQKNCNKSVRDWSSGGGSRHKSSLSIPPGDLSQFPEVISLSSLKEYCDESSKLKKCS